MDFYEKSFDLSTRSGRLDWSAYYEPLVVNWLNHKFAESSYTFELNNLINPYDIDVKIFKNDEFFGYMELKAINPEKPNNKPYFSKLNGMKSGPNLFYQKFKNNQNVWYCVLGFNSNPHKMYLAYDRHTIEKIINFDNNENLAWSVIDIYGNSTKYFTDSAFDRVYDFTF